LIAYICVHGIVQVVGDTPHAHQAQGTNRALRLFARGFGPGTLARLDRRAGISEHAPRVGEIALCFPEYAPGVLELVKSVLEPARSVGASMLGTCRNPLARARTRPERPRIRPAHRQVDVPGVPDAARNVFEAVKRELGKAKCEFGKAKRESGKAKKEDEDKARGKSDSRQGDIVVRSFVVQARRRYSSAAKGGLARPVSPGGRFLRP
jgi:hypothetical protein